MIRVSKLTLWAALLMVNLYPSTTLAQADGPQAAPLWGYLSMAAPHVTHADVLGFGGTKVSLEQAVEAVDEKQDGRVLEIGFSDHKGTMFYTVTVGTADGLRFVRVDPATGAVSKPVRPDVTRAELDQQGLHDLDTVRGAVVALGPAVASAEGLAHGHAIAAGVEQLAGIPQYYVEIASGTKLTAIIVNPTTGRAAPPTQ